MFRRLSVAFCMLIAAVAAPLSAQTLPELPETWVNGGPYTAEGLEGKGVVFYFYEENCPTCMKKWPGFVEIAQAFKDDPILFVAVNSGTSKGEVQSYMQTVKVDWPTIVDSSRAFEKKMDVGEISLRNIMAVVLLKPDGTVSRAGFDLRSAGESLKAGAKWRIDPSIVPASMKTAWRAFEFGQYQPVMPLLKRSRSGANGPFLEKLAEEINQALTERMAKAKSLEDAGKPWPAYKIYDSVVRDFGRSEGREAAAAQARLKRDAAVRKELQAAAILQKLEALAGSLSRKRQAEAQQGLAQLAAQFSGTEAAEIAKGMLK